MDNFDILNFDEEKKDPDEGAKDEKTIPFDDSEPDTASVSRKPLSLGGSDASSSPGTPEPEPPGGSPASPSTNPKPSPVAEALAQPQDHAPIQGRISGVRTFFTKLHHGAISYLDEQITHWLDEHPEITIKRTNVSVGEIRAKTTEPNLIVMIWY